MNPAARLHQVYNKLAAENQEQHMLKLWTKVFGFDPADPRAEDDVTACLMALRSEIDLTRQRLDAINVPERLTAPAFDRLRHVAAPGLLHSGWNSHKGSIQAEECRKVFEWAEWALRDEDEPDLAAEDMDDLRAELESLEVALTNTELSPYLRAFVQRQVDTIRAALRLYGIQGARPLQEAMQKVAGAYTLERPRVEAEHANASEPAKGILTKASGVIEKTAKICDNLSKVGKFGGEAWALAQTAWPQVLQSLSQIGNSAG